MLEIAKLKNMVRICILLIRHQLVTSNVISLVDKKCASYLMPLQIITVKYQILIVFTLLVSFSYGVSWSSQKCQKLVALPPIFGFFNHLKKK